MQIFNIHGRVEAGGVVKKVHCIQARCSFASLSHKISVKASPPQVTEILVVLNKNGGFVLKTGD